MEKYHCLVCNREMKSEHKLMYIDYYCNERDDHHFSYRIRENNIAKMRIRLSDRKGQNSAYLKVHYDEGYSEIWSDPNTLKSSRLKINEIVSADFTDTKKLKAKIKLLLVFA